MTGNDLIRITREEYLDDKLIPYQWSDAYLLRVANEVERDAAKRARLLLEKTNATAADVYAGNATSTSANNLVDTTKTFVSATVLGKTVYNTTDDTFAVVTSFGSGTSLGLSADIMASGEAYIIGDASKALNRVCVVSGAHSYALSNKIIKISSCYLATDGIPLTQVTEGELDELSSTWRIEVGLPKYYLETKGGIRIVPEPDATLNSSTGKAILFVESYRFPISDFTMTGSSSPEVDESWHTDLIHGICEKAYSRQDIEGFDAVKRDYHAGRFIEKFGQPQSARTEGVVRTLSSHFRLKTPKW